MKFYLTMDDSKQVSPPSLKMHLFLQDYHSLSYMIKEWRLENIEDQEAAMKDYYNMVDMIKKGQYKLHLYSNGKVKLEFLDNN